MKIALALCCAALVACGGASTPSESATDGDPPQLPAVASPDVALDVAGTKGCTLLLDAVAEAQANATPEPRYRGLAPEQYQRARTMLFTSRVKAAARVLATSFDQEAQGYAAQLATGDLDLVPPAAEFCREHASS